MGSEDSVQVYSDKHLENIGNALRNLYIEEELSDVLFCCKEGSLKAHRLILAANSPYFCKLFKENINHYPMIILQGTTMTQLNNLIDLLYKGIVDVNNKDVDAVSALVNEFEIKGVVFGPRTSNDTKIEINQNLQSSQENGHNRDTRYRGQKRVAVDFVYEKEHQSLESPTSNETESKAIKKSCQDFEMLDQLNTRMEASTNINSQSNKRGPNISQAKPLTESAPSKLNAWARKQRKFKCDLCPSSFKRSSHLSRHQLVHTGERPYSCNQCEKAFSRHDKLKHHMRKTHEFIPDSMYEKVDMEDFDGNSRTEFARRNRVTSPKNNESPGGFQSSENVSTSGFERESSPLFTISHITSILEDSFVTPPKKTRGRPRKYPPVPPPAVKRGRGRPKISEGIYPQHQTRTGNYDISNLTFGEINYLRNQTEESRSSIYDESAMLEPLVEINMGQNNISRGRENDLVRVKTENSTTTESNEVEEICVDPLEKNMPSKCKNGQCDGPTNCGNIDISEIETKIGLIGECTISVAN